MLIITISGSTHSGKTYLAQHLLEKYKIPYVSIDHLKMGIYRSNKNCGFTPLDSNEHIGDQLWPMMREMIKTAIENDQHLIIEGCYILPHHLKELEKSYADKIIPIFIVFSPSYIKGNLDLIKTNRNVIENRGEIDESDYKVDQLIEEHEDYKNRCIEEGISYFEIEENYEEEMKDVYTYIDWKKRFIES